VTCDESSALQIVADLTHHSPLVTRHCIPGGFFSVHFRTRSSLAAVTSPRVTGHTTLWSSDFLPPSLKETEPATV